MATKTKIIVNYACWEANELSQQDQKLGGVYFLVTQKQKMAVGDTKWLPK